MNSFISISMRTSLYIKHIRDYTDYSLNAHILIDADLELVRSQLKLQLIKRYIVYDRSLRTLVYELNTFLESI